MQSDLCTREQGHYKRIATKAGRAAGTGGAPTCSLAYIHLRANETERKLLTVRRKADVSVENAAGGDAAVPAMRPAKRRKFLHAFFDD